MNKPEAFEKICKKLFGSLAPKEHLFINLSGETSHFMRLNGAKIRQTGLVEDAQLDLTLVKETPEGLKKASSSFNLDFTQTDLLDDMPRELAALQHIVEQLPVDPFAFLPTGNQTSQKSSRGKLLEPDQVAETLLPTMKGTDLAGIWASGPLYRGMAHSGGLQHWFETETFSMDYSIYSGHRAVKGCYSGTEFHADTFRASLERDQKKLSYLEMKPVTVSRGSYRTFLESDAVGALLQVLNWGCFSEAVFRRSGSPLRRLRQGEANLSPLFTIREDFSGGENPRFNEDGELAPESLALIEAGQLKNTLISSRSAKEYGLTSNGASEHETLRSPSMAGGTLSFANAHEALGEGLYLSNLHYLNWSDFPGGRVTGMTRFACFWVKNGKIQGPIENLRFDDTVFRLLGTEVEALTKEVDTQIETMTYESRHPGVVKNPGMLLKSMQFTL